jgi:molecular chaperone HtpG
MIMEKYPRLSKPAPDPVRRRKLLLHAAEIRKLDRETHFDELWLCGDPSQFKPLLERLKGTLKDRAKDVRVTTRLVDSPACLVVEEGDMSAHLARLLKQAGQDAPKAKPILEINPQHALIQRLQSDSAPFDDLAHIVFDQAWLAEGGHLEDPSGYVQRVTRLLSAAS